MRDDGAHIEHLSREPDGVRRAYEVFDPRRIDTRGHWFARHLSLCGRVGQSDARGIFKAVRLFATLINHPTPEDSATVARRYSDRSTFDEVGDMTPVNFLPKQ
jgi:hypothetical protein